MPTLDVAIDARGSVRGARDFDRAKRSIVSGSRDIDRSVKSVDGRIRDVGATANRAGSSLGGLFVGVASGVAVRQAFKTISSFEEQILTIRAIARPLEKDLERVVNTAKNLGATTRFSASEAASAFVELTRAGFDVETQLQQIETVLGLAIAGQTDLATSSTILINSLNQFNLAASESGRVGDVLVKAANSSATSVLDIAQALSFAGIAAAQSNISFEETNAALAALANQSLGGARGGNTLRGAISILNSPTNEALATLSPLLEAQGRTFDDVRPKVVGLTEALSNLSQIEFDAFEVFGAERGTGIAVLTSEAALKTLRELTPELKNATGELDNFAKTVDSGLIGSFKSLLSAIENLQLSLGTDSNVEGSLIASVKLGIDTTTQAIRIIGGVEGAMQEASQASIILADVLKVLAGVIGFIAAVKIVATLVGMTDATIALGVAMKNVTIASIIPFAGAILAITGLELGRYFFDEFRIVQEVMARAIFNVTSFTDKAQAGFRAMFEYIRTEWNFVMDFLTTRLRRTVEGFAITLRAVGNNDIADSLDAWAQGLRSVAERQFDAVGRFVSAANQGRPSITDPAVNQGINELARTLPRFILDDSEDGIGKVFTDDDVLAFDRSVKAFENILKTSELTPELIRIRDTARELNDAFVADLPIDERLSRLNSSLQEKLDFNKAVLDSTLAEIDAQFEGQSRRGDTFIDFLANDIQTLIETLEVVPPAIDEFFKFPEAIEEVAQATNESTEAFEEYAQAAEKAATATSSVTAAQQDAREAIRRALEAVETEVEIVGRLSESRERSRDVVEFLIQAERAYGAGTEEAIAATDRYKEALDKLREAEVLEGVITDLGDAFANAFADAITGAESFDAVLKTLINSIISIGAAAFIGDPLRATFTGGAGGLFNSAQGNVFNAGRIIPFAQGGIINGPVTFPLTNGTGLAGEAGPEAIVPLRRDSAGNLGVSGGGGTTVNMTIVTQDADSFRRNSRQVKRSVQRMTR